MKGFKVRLERGEHRGVDVVLVLSTVAWMLSRYIILSIWVCSEDLRLSTAHVVAKLQRGHNFTLPRISYKRLSDIR